MNSLKPLFVVAVLAAIAYGAYVSINRNQQLSTTAPGDAPTFTAMPSVEIPGSPTAGNGTIAPRYLPQGVSTSPDAVPPGVVMPPGVPYGNAAGSTAGGMPSAQTPLVEPGNVASAAKQPGVAMPYPSSASRNQIAMPSDVSRQASALQSIAVSERSGEEKLPNKYDALLKAIRRQLDEGRLSQAHLALSNLHNNPELTPAQASQAVDLLDQLAGTVIYSRQHLLERPYKVQPGDTLRRIAETHNVPWQLLANINGIRDPQYLQPGSELKVVRGPFDAVIHLGKYELTLMLSGRYAGTFPIGVGQDLPNMEGSYVVCGKNENPQYHGPDRVVIDADDRNNPLGEFSISLGKRIGQPGQLAIHGTNDPTSLHAIGGRGSIRLGEKDIKDLHGILSVGPVASRVTIMR